MAQSRTAVNAKASGAEPMHKLTDTGAVPAGGETQQVGGPTPENYKSDDESAKLSANAPGQSKTAVNSKACLLYTSPSPRD